MKERRRRKLIERAQPLLPGAVIRQVAMAQTRAWYWLALSGVILWVFINRYRFIVVTDDAVHLLDCGALGSRPTGVLQSLPRTTRFGPTRGIATQVTLGSERLYVPRAFYAELNAADAMLGAVPAAAVAYPVAAVPDPAPAPAAPSTARLSPDGRYWWSGTAWVDCHVTLPPGVRRSPDGHYWWDGSSWRTVGSASQ